MLVALVLLIVQTVSQLGTTITAMAWATEGGAWHFFAVLSVVLAFYNGCAAIWKSHRLEQARQKSEAQIALNAALTKIMQKARVNPDVVGLHAYVVRRSFFPWQAPHQERVARLRLSNYPPASGTLWGPNKGVVGQCWARRHQIVVLEPGKSLPQLLQCTEAEWNAAPEEQRQGLSFNEWEATRRYTYIAAVPVQAGERYVGCITIDTVEPGSADRLKIAAVRDILLDTAGTMSHVFKAR